MQNVTLAIGGITLGAIYALVALGFNLIYRTVNVLDFETARALLSCAETREAGSRRAHSSPRSA